MKNGYFIGNIPNIFRQTHMTELTMFFCIWLKYDWNDLMTNGLPVLKHAESISIGRTIVPREVEKSMRYRDDEDSYTNQW